MMLVANHKAMGISMSALTAHRPFDSGKLATALLFLPPLFCLSFLLLPPPLRVSLLAFQLTLFDAGVGAIWTLPGAHSLAADLFTTGADPQRPVAFHLAISIAIFAGLFPESFHR